MRLFVPSRFTVQFFTKENKNGELERVNHLKQVWRSLVQVGLRSYANRDRDAEVQGHAGPMPRQGRCRGPGPCRADRCEAEKKSGCKSFSISLLTVKRRNI